MKKINLNLVKAFLSRDEMRVISGGCGGDGVCNADSGCSTGCSTFNGSKYICDRCCIA